MIPLVRFKLAAYTRSHRLLQPVIALCAMLAIFYSSPGPALESYSDSAALLIIVFAWAAKSLLDTEPPTQRLISMTAAGNPRREVVSGLAAAFTVNLGLATVAVVAPLLIRFGSLPPPGDLARGVGLHLLGVCVGTALGALASAPILTSPATSLVVLFGGYVAMLLLSLTPIGGFLVPIMPWMRATNSGRLDEVLPQIAAATLLWSAAGVLAYLHLRRTRP
ncbi:hypothetical protein [Streptosporangium saharense]|uniref:hypothetical protein n=1 Tax=Streptosporangium saharense TaxID=1706840 RepID=UPI003328676F